MIRNILFCLLLSGCAYYNISPTTSYVEANTSPTQTTVSSANGVRWQCDQTTVNDALVWVVCDFQNTSHEVSNVCIGVSYANIHSGDMVPNHRTICSGDLSPQMTSENYAAFVNSKNKKLVEDSTSDERTRLAKLCGPLLSNCKLETYVPR